MIPCYSCCFLAIPKTSSNQPDWAPPPSQGRCDRAGDLDLCPCNSQLLAGWVSSAELCGSLLTRCWFRLNVDVDKNEVEVEVDHGDGDDDDDDGDGDGGCGCGDDGDDDDNGGDDYGGGGDGDGGCGGGDDDDDDDDGGDNYGDGDDDGDKIILIVYIFF